MAITGNGYLSKVRSKESARNDKATNIHGASGRYQFLPSTWTGMGYDIKDIYNPKLQEEAMAKYTQNSTNYLKKTLGITPTDVDLYGAHFLGPAGYVKLYKTADNAPISTVMSPKAINDNPHVKGKTVGEVKNWLSKSMGGTGSSQDNSPIEYTDYTSGLAPLPGEVAGYKREEETVKENPFEKLAEKQQEENFTNEVRQQQEQQYQQEQAQPNPLYTEENYQIQQFQPTQYQGQIFSEGYFQDGGESMFTASGNPVIVPSQGSYPLSYRDRGERDIDGTLFSSAKKVSRVDKNGKPLVRNQIAENQIMWNMQKEAYSPAQQHFNAWKNNEENTEKGYYNTKDYSRLTRDYNAQPDIGQQGLSDPNFSSTKCGISKQHAKDDKREWSKKQDGGTISNNEKAFLKEYAEGGTIPVSSNGVYDYPEQEVIVPTNSGRITMKNVPYPILGVDEYGNQQLMKPNGEYQFPGKTIHEIPQIKNKISIKSKLK